MTDETWNSPDVRCLGVRLNGDAIDEVDERGERIVGDTLLLLLNAGERRRSPFVLPATAPDERWETLIDTADPWAAVAAAARRRPLRAAGAIDGGAAAELPQGRPAAVRGLGADGGVLSSARDRCSGIAIVDLRLSRIRSDSETIGDWRSRTQRQRRRPSDGRPAPDRASADRDSIRAAAARRRRGRPSRRSTRAGFPIKRASGEDGDRRRRHLHADGHDVLAAALLYRRAGEARLARGADGSRSATTAGRRLRGRRARRATSTRSKAGSTASAAGGTSSRRSSAPARTSRASCSKARAHRPRDDRRGPAIAADAEERWRQIAATLGDEPIPQPRTRGAGAGRRRRRGDGQRTRTASRPTRYGRELQVIVERERARFGAWYEMFPRSAGHRSRRGAPRSTRPRRGCPTSRRWASTCSTCRRSIRSAAASARGRTTRSTPGPDDPGSPWAIGGRGGRPHGGRAGRSARSTTSTASSRRRGGTASRSRSTSPTRRRPIIRTSRQHPGVVPAAARRHDQVRREPAEEVPGHLSDRLRVGATGQALWRELKRVIEFWIGHGVRIFRVDNPHTKPFRFWEWALAEIKRAASRTPSSCPRRSPGRR